MRASADHTVDRLLDGRVVLKQPTGGYRAAIDPVFLSSAVPAKPGERILDAGCGGGAASLCLAARVAGCRVEGVDNAEDLLRLARESAVESGCAERVSFHLADIAAGWDSAGLEPFDQVMTNPPFLSSRDGNASPRAARRRASVLDRITMADWLGFCVDALRAKGRLTLIHRADRLAQIVAALEGRVGGITIFPLWPKAGRTARRVLVTGRKGVSSPSAVSAGLVLHAGDGHYTAEAQAVLRRAAALDIHRPRQ